MSKLIELLSWDRKAGAPGTKTSYDPNSIQRIIERTFRTNDGKIVIGCAVTCIGSAHAYETHEIAMSEKVIREAMLSAGCSGDKVMGRGDDLPILPVPTSAPAAALSATPSTSSVDTAVKAPPGPPDPPRPATWHEVG